MFLRIIIDFHFIILVQEVSTCFYDTCVPRDGDDEQESPSPVEKGERARLGG